MSLKTAITNFGSTLVSEKTKALVASAATAGVTYAGHSIAALAPVFTNTLLEGGVFGLVVNRVSTLADYYLKGTLNGKLRHLTSIGLGGATATALSYGAVQLGISAAAVTPAGALALTVTAAVARFFAPSDKTVKAKAYAVFVETPRNVWNWAFTPKALNPIP
jgi:hypothetical protein